MLTTVNTSDNTVTISEANNSVSVTNNNTGTLVNVSGIDISTVTVAAPGPKGDKGDSPSTIDASSIIQPFTNVTASGHISASGNVITSKSGLPGSQYINYNTDGIEINVDDSNAIKINDNQAVAIGTSTIPSNIRLHVEGATSINGTLSASGNFTGANLDINGNADISGNITASGNISSSGDIYANTQYNLSGHSFLTEFHGLSGLQQVVGHSDRSLTLIGQHIEIGNSANIRHVTASGEISASGAVYSGNVESIALSFQASGDGSNWHGPNKQGPYYYVYNFNYGDDTAVATLAQENVVAGIIVPYKCTLVGFKAVVSHLTQASTVRVALYKGRLDGGSFNDTDDAADDMILQSVAAGLSGTPGAAENPMTISVTDSTAALVAGDMLYPRIKCGGAGGAHVSMQILLKRRK